VRAAPLLASLALGALVAMAPGRASAQTGPLTPLPPLPPATETTEPATSLPALPEPDEPPTPVRRPAATPPATTGATEPGAAPIEGNEGEQAADEAAEASAREEDEKAADASSGPPVPDLFATRHLMLEGSLGLGTPVGIAGIAVDYSPWPFLGLNLGIGLGLAGLQYGFTPRVRLFRAGKHTQVALYLGAGASAGAYKQPSVNFDLFSSLDDGGDPGPSAPTSRWAMAYWANAEIGVEIRKEAGPAFRPYLGVSRLLNTQPSSVEGGGDFNSGPPPAVEAWQAYIGLGLGYTMPGL
jgi:hypothetical protein